MKTAKALPRDFAELAVVGLCRRGGHAAQNTDKFHCAIIRSEACNLPSLTPGGLSRPALF
jgi:hypothetical protein